MTKHVQSEPIACGRLYIVGAGGHGREMAWLASEIWGAEVELRFVVDSQKYLCDPVAGIPVFLLSNISEKDGAYVVAVGDPLARRRLVGKMHDAGFRSQTMIHPGVVMSPRIALDDGVVIAAGCILTTDIRIGSHVHINLGCTISHDVSVGAFTTISPGVNVSGYVEIGENVFVGAGATIINGKIGQRLFIGDNAIIAAGACVTRPVEAGAMVAGVPAVRRK